MKAIWTSAVALVLSVAAAQAQPAGPKEGSGQPPGEEDSLIGLWAYETTFGSPLKGQLTVTRECSNWRASISDAVADFQVVGEEIRFAFPRDRGQFRGRLIENGRAIEGFWLRPGVTADPRYPAGSSQPFATPLVLRSVGNAVWRGTVRPLEDRFTLHLRIFREKGGALAGAFRDPEQNGHGGAMRYRVTREGGKVHFTARPDETQPEIRHSATLARSPDRLQLSWGDLGRVIELTRRTPQQAANFFPRPPGEPRYVYRKPPATDDGWVTAGAGEVGMDEAALARLVQQLIETDPFAQRPALIHSLLVARRGKLVLEEYFFGFERDRPHDTRSAGKTFASVLLGAAMRKDARIGPETKVYELLAGMGPFANPDPRKARMTLAHLMTHTSGFACNDYDDASPGNEVTMQTQVRQPNWWKYTLDLPMAHEPGSRYAYGSANMNLMGAALTTATKTWLPELFEREVARPLQFGPYHWNLMPNGEGYLGGGAFLRPRDLLKIGQVYLDGGTWQGRRIVEAAWVKRSTSAQMKISPKTTGLDPKEFPDFYNECDDGYAWHLNGLRLGERTCHEFEASGNGGQLLIVVPEFDLVVVLTGGNYRQGGIWGRWRNDVVGKGLITAIQR